MSIVLEKELEKYYTDRFSMMATTGWKEFVEDAQNLYDAYNQITGIDSENDVQKRKGQLDILQWIISLKDVSEQTYEELQREDSV